MSKKVVCIQCGEGPCQYGNFGKPRAPTFKTCMVEKREIKSLAAVIVAAAAENLLRGGLA